MSTLGRFLHVGILSPDRMLREKTLGNLDEQERHLFDSLLYELQIKFVEISR